MKGKHSETKKGRNKTKIIIFTLIVFILIAILVILFRTYINKKEIKNTINSAFISLRDGNIEGAKENIDYLKVLSILDEEMLKEEDIQKVGLEKEFFRELKWTIKNIKLEKNQAVAEVEISNKDYKNIIIEWLKTILKEQEDGINLTNDIYLDNLKNAILNEEIEINTNIEEIYLEKEDKWKIIVNNNLGNALFPGIESINEALKE